MGAPGDLLGRGVARGAEERALGGAVALIEELGHAEVETVTSIGSPARGTGCFGLRSRWTTPAAWAASTAAAGLCDECDDDVRRARAGHGAGAPRRVSPTSKAASTMNGTPVSVDVVVEDLDDPRCATAAITSSLAADRARASTSSGSAWSTLIAKRRGKAAVLGGKHLAAAAGAQQTSARR